MNNRRKLSPVQRRAVYNKMDGRCAYCGEVLAYDDMQVDYVTPLQGFKDDARNVLDNMLPVCRSCNHYKRGNTLEVWRRMLEAIPATLTQDCYIYRHAVRFGVVTPTPRKVIFYFERIRNHNQRQRDVVEFG